MANAYRKQFPKTTKNPALHNAQKISIEPNNWV